MSYEYERTKNEPYELTSEELEARNNLYNSMYDFSRNNVEPAGEAGIDINEQAVDFEASQVSTDDSSTYEESLGNRFAAGRPDVNLRTTGGVNPEGVDGAMSRRTQEVLNEVTGDNDPAGDEGGLRREHERSAILDTVERDTLENREQRANEEIAETTVASTLNKFGIQGDNAQVMERYLGEQVNDERDGNHQDPDLQQPNIMGSESLHDVALASVASQFVDKVRENPEVLNQLRPDARAEVVAWLDGIGRHGGGRGETNERLEPLGKIITEGIDETKAVA